MSRLYHLSSHPKQLGEASLAEKGEEIESTLSFRIQPDPPGKPGARQNFIFLQLGLYQIEALKMH